MIVSHTMAGGIGYGGRIPWDIKEINDRLDNLTLYAPEGMVNLVVVGAPSRAVPGCTQEGAREVMVVDRYTSVNQVIEHVNNRSDIYSVNIIGGETIYKMFADYVHRIYSAIVWSAVHTDKVFPMELYSGFEIVYCSELCRDEANKYQFYEFKRARLPEWRIIEPAIHNEEELQYLKLVHEVIKYGKDRIDRTGVGTRSVFGRQMHFDLRTHIPVLTTKRVFWRGVVEELLWFIRGGTHSADLSSRGVKIWDKNGSREYLDKIGLRDRVDGDLGPIYGFQWRHFGAAYTSHAESYEGAGVDQLNQVIEMIKTDPFSRRIIMSAWNPADLSKMALPPCHVMCQFYVHDGRLSCQMYQRSCDLGLGVPFNIASYSLLTLLVADVCGLMPGDFIHVMGDVHVYNNHIDALEVQLSRAPRAFPRVKITHRESIDEFTVDDIELVDYNPHKSIPMSMAV